MTPSLAVPGIGAGVSAVARIGAVLAGGSSVLHGLSLGHPRGFIGTALLLAMAVACLYCAAELWIRDTDRAWVLVAVMNLGMIAVHLPTAGGHHSGAQASAVTVPTVTPMATPMAVATAFAIAEAVLATVVLAHRSRRYSPGGADLT